MKGGRPPKFTKEDFEFCVRMMNEGYSQGFIAWKVYNVDQTTLSENMYRAKKRYSKKNISNAPD